MNPKCLLDTDVLVAFLGFLREYRNKGISLGLADVMIGATAIIQNLTLLTYNARHYPMSEIKIFQPQ